VTDAQKEYDDIAETGDTEQIKNAKDKLDKAKDSESQAKARYSLARSRMRAEAESQAQLVKATRLQTEAIKEQGAVLKDQAAAQVAASQKAIDSARLAWQMAQTDTAGKISLLEEESKKYDQNSVEWYQIQTQKINLEKQLQDEQERTAEAAAGGGGGGAGALSAPITAAIDKLDILKGNLNKMTMPDFLDPMVMQMSAPPKTLFQLIGDLGKSLSSRFMDDFLKELWGRFKIALGLPVDATVGDSATLLGGKLGNAIGEAITDAIVGKLRGLFSAENMAKLGLDIFGLTPIGELDWYKNQRSSGSPSGTYYGDSGINAPTSNASSNGSTYNINIQTNDQGIISKLRELGVAV
jgi:hypothetical protein